MRTIHAIYEDGVFKPTEPVDLPDHCAVKVEPDLENAPIERVEESSADSITEALNKIYGEGKESSELDPFFLRAQALTLQRNPD